VALAANFLFVLYLKRRPHPAKNGRMPNLLGHAQKNAIGKLADDEVQSLIEQSSKELDVTADELMQMSAEQIQRLATEKLLHAKAEAYERERAAIDKVGDVQQNDDRIDP
jgi:hypothetical protein